MKMRLKKPLALLLALALCLSLLPVGVLAAATRKDVVRFSYADTNLTVTGDPANVSTTLTSTVTSHVIGSGRYGGAKWDAASEPVGEKAFYFTISTLGYTELQISYKARSSKTGPASYQAQYRLPGGVWTNIAGGAVDLSGITATTTKECAPAAIPVDAENKPAVELRILASQQTPSGTALGNAGTGYIEGFVLVTGMSEDAAPPKAATPVAAPVGGEVEKGAAVTLTSATEGAAIYYTLDGSTPTTASTLYSQPIIVGEAVTLKAIAVKDSMEPSGVLETAYTMAATPTPTPTPPDPGPGTVGDVIPDVVSWSAGSAQTLPADAMSGLNKTGAELSVGGAVAAPATARGFSASGWDNGTGNKYWQVKLSAKGVCELALSSVSSSSSTGPSAFRVEYSLDGSTFFPVGGSNITLTTVSGQSYGQAALKALPLPAKADNCDTLYLRWLMDSNTALNGSAVGSGGTSQLNGVVISGKEFFAAGQVAPAKADPAAGAVPVGSQVLLRSVTTGAAIHYTTDNSTPTASSPLYTGPITLSTLPATVKAVAIKDGASSAVSTFEYTQARAGAITCNRADGSKVAPLVDQITFTAGPGDTIKYKMTANTNTPTAVEGPETTYDPAAPITVTAKQFPVSFRVWAVRDGCLDGPGATFGFILNAGGEPKNYFGQLHSHTAENSDGAGTLEDAFSYAATKSGVDFLAVTDHSNSFDTANKADTAATYNLTTYNADNAKWVKGHTMADKYTTDKFIGIYGYEMTWSGGPGHINTFNTTGFVSRNNTVLNSKTNDSGMKAYYELLSRPDSSGSISQFNHPGKTFGNFTNFGYWNPVIDSRISLVEVGNGEGAVGSGGYFPSYSEYTLALDKGWHLAPTNNQDNHQGKWGDANTARTVVYTNDFTRDGIYQALREMRVYATEDKNLDIVYTLNGAPLGTTFEQVPAAAAFKVAVKDPDATDKIASIAIISVGGKTVYEETPAQQNYTMEYTIPAPAAGYYYIRVTQADKDIAVTAPIWLGAAPAVGMSEVTTDAYMAVKNQPMSLKVTFFNNETAPVTLKSVTYALKDGPVLSTLTPNAPIAPSANLEQSFTYTPAALGAQTVTVTAVLTVAGTDKTFTGSLSMDARDPDKLISVGVDGSHYNEYVAGNYKDSMGNFAKLAGGYDVQVNVLKTSAELIAALENPKYQMLIFTAPTRRLSGVTYLDYTDAELAAVAAFTARGGTLVVTGWGDYYESYDTAPKGPERQMAAQQNRLLKAAGSSLRLADDEAKDNVNNPGSNAARLYLTDYNGAKSPLLTGVNPKQVFSQYGGSTVFAVDGTGKPAAALPAGVIPVISGYGVLNADGTGKVLNAITSEDDDKDGYGLECGSQKPPRYPSDNGATALLTATETVQRPGGASSLVVVSGGAFMSNFEIKAELDNATSLNYSNYNFLSNLIETLKPTEVSTIAQVTTNGVKGNTYTVEGTVMSSVNNGTDLNTGFFDCVYIQDATGGINVFPVASGVEPGQKVRVTGVYDAYEGERQLQSAKVKVISAVPGALPAPREVSTKDVADRTYLGQLVKATGKVLSVDEAGGVVNSFLLQDASGTACKVFIDGYITKGKTIPGLAVGKTFSAVGFSSYNKDSARIRVRDRAEITPVQVQETGKIVILHTNDVHCQVDQAVGKDGKVTNLGYAGVAAYKADMAGQYGAKNVTLVDAGDAIQGGPIGTLSKGSYIVDIMNKVGYDVAIPGNHEFDYGMDNFLSLAKEKANYPYVCANFTNKDGSSVFNAYKLVDYGSTQVAYVGISTPETFTKSTPTYFQDANGNYIYGFCEGNSGKDLYNKVQSAVNAARGAGADYVVAVGHLGIDAASKPWTSEEVIANTTGIDVMIDGHSHSTFERTVTNKVGKSVLMAQTGTKLANLGKVVIDTSTGAITAELVSGYAAQEPTVAAYVKSVNDQFSALLKTVVAKSSVNLTTLDPDTGKRAVRSAETNLGDLCADAYRTLLGADVAFVNGGGVRDNIPAGDITYEQIIKVHPFGNEACLIETTGQKILDALEMGASALPGELGGFLQVSGVTFTVVKGIPSSVVLNDKKEFVKVDGPYRVTNVMVGGVPLDVNKTYTLAAHNYMLKSGGDGFTMFKGDKLLKDCVMIDNQVLINYMTGTLKGVVGSEYSNPRGQGRITIVDQLPPVVTMPSAPKVTETATAVTVKLTASGSKLSSTAAAKVVAANAAKSVEISGNGLNITIPAGTLAPGANLNAMLVNPKAAGNVIQVTRPDGSTVILPFATVGGGNASYLANVAGSYSVIDNTRTFSDTAGHWAQAAIAFAASHELFKGAADGSFRPEQPMTRGMLVTVLSRMDGGSTAAGAAFADVPAASWYGGAVAWAAENGIVTGDGASFSPDATLTREQLCTILARYLKHAGLTLAESKSLGDYPDMSSVSPWARESVELAVKAGLLDGKSGGLLDPQGQASRAEIAAILQRFVEGVLK